MDDPKQILGDDSPQIKHLAGSLSLFDINILPQRYRRRKIRFINILPWLVFLLLLGALYPSGITAMGAQSEFRLHQRKLNGLQSLIETYQSTAGEMESLQTEIDLQIERRDQILSSYQGLDLKGSNWSRILFLIEENAPVGILWTQITQKDGEIRLDGIANSYPTVLSLRDSLKKIDGIIRIQIDSIDQILEESPAIISSETGEDNQPASIQTPSYHFTLSALAAEEGLK
jgi:Tfp pilus assembly protein PilN